MDRRPRSGPEEQPDRQLESHDSEPPSSTEVEPTPVVDAARTPDSGSAAPRDDTLGRVDPDTRRVPTDAGGDGSAPPAPDSNRSETDDAFASYPPDLRELMLQDDTAARLPYLSKPPTTPTEPLFATASAGDARSTNDPGPAINSEPSTNGLTPEPAADATADTVREAQADQPVPAAHDAVAAHPTPTTAGDPLADSVSEPLGEQDDTDGDLGDGFSSPTSQTDGSDRPHASRDDSEPGQEHPSPSIVAGELDRADEVVDSDLDRGSDELSETTTTTTDGTDGTTATEAEDLASSVDDSMPARVDNDDSAMADDSNDAQEPVEDPAPEPLSLDSEIDGETVRARLERWDPERLNLSRPTEAEVPDVSNAESSDQPDQRSADERNAVAYIAANKESRPWLAPAADCEPIVQSIYASIDQGIGHAHIRHGPMGDDTMYAARVAHLEDPAQLDPQQRGRSVDGLEPSNLHRCAQLATRINDTYAFAAGMVAASEDPRVSQALNTGWDEAPPKPVTIPISELLGLNGHQYCSGFRLKGEWPESRVQRKQWAQTRAAGEDLSGLSEPQAERVPTFEGGKFVVIFKKNHSTRKYEINTIVATPAEN